MKKNSFQKIIFTLLLSCIFVSFLTVPANAAAGINRTVSFQGRVVNKTDGTNITDGNYTFIFKIYDASAAGTKLWGDETQTTIPVTNGIFTVALGSVRSFATDNLDFNQDNLWLDVTFNGENFGSRVRLASVPYAMTAEKVNGLTVTSTTGTLTIQNAKTISFADAFTTSGANPLTLTTIGTTNVTLPTTGTLFTNTATGVQTLTSTQTTGTILGIADSTTETAALVGQSITLSGTGAFDQTGLQFNLSGASGTNLNDIVGSGSTWKVSKTGALTVASCTGCGGGGATLQTAYAAGNTITTTTGSDIAFVLPAGLGTRTKFSLTNSDTTAGSDFYLNSANASGTSTNGLFLEQTGAGILTNGLNITRTAGTLTNGLSFAGTIGTDITTSGARALTIDTGGAAGITIGGINANALTLGNITNTATITHNSSASTGTGASSGFVFNDTALTTGTGLQFTVADPEVNSNSGTFSTGKLINIASTNHSYMTLDNKDLTIGGHKNNVTISGVTDVFMYDTGGDMDGGKWTDGARAQASSWYNETLDDAGVDCNIATMDRCGQRAFPNKAIIVTNATNVYVFDAKNNLMWMRFDKGPTTTEWMIGPTTNSTVSTVFALNGKIYIGNAGSVGQMYSVNFISDIAKRYNSTDDYQGNLKVGVRNSAVTWVSSVGQPLPGNVISDINGSVINGKVYIAVAYEPTSGSANGSASVINETDQNILNFGISANNTASKNVFLTPNGDFYATIGNATTNAAATNYFIKAKHGIYNMVPNSNNTAFSEIYGNVGTGSTQYGVSIVDAAFGSITFTNGPAPADATFIPQSLVVTSGTSIDNGRSNSLYIGNNDNLMILQEKQGTTVPILQQGNVKYMTKDYISEYMFSDVRGMWPMSSTGSLNDVSVKANTALTNNGISTFTSGVRGLAGTFNGSTQYLSLADNTALSVTGALSFGGWFKTNNAAAQQFIVTKNGSYTLQVTATGKVQADVIGGTTGTRISNNSIDTGWHNVVAVYTPSTLSLDIYIDGILTNGTLSGTVPASITDSAGAFNIGANAGATFFNGQIDEVFVTADSLNSAIVKSMYRVGYRALSQHASDTLQQLSGSSSQVNAVAVDLEGGTVYAGTNGGGVTVIGTDTDSQLRTYTTGANPDDTGTNFANATINSISLGRGFGVGNILAIGNGSGAWIESEDTQFKEFLSQAYNPFGLTMVQSTLNIDNTLRVTNQLSTRLDNLASFNSPQVGLVEFFRADANGAAATAFKGIAGDLNLQAGNTDQIKFLNNAGATTGRIDAAGLTGDGADGPITISASKSLNSDIIGSARTNYADGIAYRVVAPTIGDTSVTQFSSSDVLSNGIAPGDEVLLINLQGSANDGADVGKYQFMRVQTVTAGTITFSTRINVSLKGTTASNQKVVVQRVPNYTSVTVAASGTLTTGAYDGMTTTPTGTAGRLTGVVAFRANGTVSVAGSQTINATGKGYRGGAAGTAGAVGGTSGENVVASSGTGGSGATVATAGFSGGRGGDGGTTTPATNFTTTATDIRTGGGGGGSSGSGVSTGGGAGGGGGSYGTAGGGGGGAGGTTNGAAGGAAGAVPGGGGGGTDVAGTGGAGGAGVVGVTATGGTSNGVGGAVGTATVTSSGGGGSSATGGGGGGGTGVIYGAAALTTMFMGSGGGGGGGATNANVAGGAGGTGGGIVYIAADTITVTGNIQSNGTAGTAGTTKAGGGGGGAGGSVYVQGKTLTLGSSLVTATGGAGATKVGVGGGGGAGGVGRIAYASMLSAAQTTSPAGTNNGTLSDLGTLYIRQTVNTGADLAEDYTAADDSIQAGDLVVISDNKVVDENGDEISTKGVLRKSHGPYERKLIGVISSDPGVLLGNKDASAEDAVLQRHLALTGRVPVKVSSENGVIKTGDYLTSSSIPGVAMKAVKSGVVVGQALEDYNGAGVGLISGFVKASYFNGESLEEYVSALKMDNSTPLAQLLLDQFVATNAPGDSSAVSSMLTDRLAAGVEVITPKISARIANIDVISGTTASFSGVLTADVIRANRIEGLEVITDKISSLSQAIAEGKTSPLDLVHKQNSDLENSVASLSATLASMKDINLASSSSLMHLSNGMMVTGGGWFDHASIDSSLVIGSNLTLASHTINTIGESLDIQSLAQGPISFMKGFITIDTTGLLKVFGNAEFHGESTFIGRPTFNADTAGFAVIKKDSRSVTIAFDKEYVSLPVVIASISYDFNADGKSDSEKAIQDAIEQKILNGNMSYIVTQKTTKGFKIKLNKNAEEDIMFSWNAISIKNAKTAVGDADVAGLSTQISPAPSFLRASPVPDTSSFFATGSALQN